MSLLDTLSAFFARPAKQTAAEVPEGACPNCWGHYEYDGEIRKVARDRQTRPPRRTVSCRGVRLTRRDEGPCRRHVAEEATPSAGRLGRQPSDRLLRVRAAGHCSHRH